MIHEWLSRLRFLLGQNLLRRGRQTHIDEELQFHQEQATAANLALGMTAANWNSGAGCALCAAGISAQPGVYDCCDRDAGPGIGASTAVFSESHPCCGGDANQVGNAN
jgi:hypothetical protein